MLFKPKKYFAGLEGSYFGWKGLAVKGIKFIDMPLYPKGILAEPFVKILAERLKNEIEISLQKKSRGTAPNLKHFSSEVTRELETV